jgi:hypothetical protein
MFRTIAKRRHCRLGLEPLEAREILSGSSSSHAIVGGDATPEAAVSITLHRAGSTVVLRKAIASGKLRRVAKTHAVRYATVKRSRLCLRIVRASSNRDLNTGFSENSEVKGNE